MEWSKEKTLKLIQLMQVNTSLWNPSLCDTRKDKQKRKDELRTISEILDISIPDTTKKIQHLRTQYNRESAREARANAEDPTDRFISNWYAYEYLHFMKDSSKHYRLLQYDDQAEVNSTGENKYTDLSPPHKISRIDSVQKVKTEIIYPQAQKTRDEFSVFGEYVANELRSLKGEKNLLVAKKKIQDAIFEVKMGLIHEQRESSCTVYSNGTSHSPKMYSAPVTAHIETIPTHNTPTSGIGEIIISGPCHYSNFKVDSQ